MMTEGSNLACHAALRRDIPSGSGHVVVDRSSCEVRKAVGFESGERYVPRAVEVNGLLDLYRSIDPTLVPSDTRERLLFYAVEGVKKQWFEPFKDGITGDMLPPHQFAFVEHETDASEIRTYEHDLVPGLVQTLGYAMAVADLFYPARPAKDHLQFAEFRLARRRALRLRAESVRSREDSVIVSFAINEIVLRRTIGTSAILREQLAAIIAAMQDPNESFDLRVVPMATSIPAALGGSFVVFSSPSGGEGDGIVYLESRSGGNYLKDPAAVERFTSYFTDLRDVCLSAPEAVSMIESIIEDLPE